MAELKTKETKSSVDDFIGQVSDKQVREDCSSLIKIMKKVTGEKPKMWGPSIIGFGSYHYKYESGHEGEMCLVGFSPRAGKISLYVKAGSEKAKPLLEKLGKHKAATGCVYIKKLEDVNVPVLEKIVALSVSELKKEYPDQSSKTDKSKSIKPKSSDTAQIETYISKVAPALKDSVETLRKIIKGSDKRINERFKWNAPSYYFNEDLVTFGPIKNGRLLLVFHHPLIEKIKSPLLEGEYKGRRLMYFDDLKAIRSSKKELHRILGELVKGIERK